MSQRGTLVGTAAAGLLVIAVASCGSQAARTTAAADVVSGSCMSSGINGHTTSESCEFVLSDGRRFRCPHELKGPPTSRALKAAGCVQLRSLVLSAAQRSLISKVDRARNCLRGKGLRAFGGPVLPVNSQTADGEIVVSSPHPTFVAFYSDVAKARRVESSAARSVRFHGLVEDRGTVRIIWTHAPTSALRSAVEACSFR
jgi:hypothetical protein